MQEIFKYPIIMCNLSTSAYQDEIFTGDEDSLCILYKDYDEKAQYIKINLKSIDNIELINFTKQNQGYIFFCNTSTKGIFGEKKQSHISKIVIPENIMFK